MTPQAFAEVMDRAYLSMRPWSAQMIEDTITHPHTRFLTSERGGLIARIVGGECEILALATEPNAQRAGVATALLERLHDLARRERADTIILEVAAKNRAARAFYAARGFAQIGRRNDYYSLRDGTKDDALMLSRSIADTAAADAPTSNEDGAKSS